IERQVRRYKERIRDHKPHTGPGVPIRVTALSAESMEPPAEVTPAAAAARREARAEAAAAGLPHPTPPPPSASQIIKSSKFFAKPMAVEEAVMQMNLLGNEFLVFMNAETRQVNVVYRRKDGN